MKEIAMSNHREQQLEAEADAIRFEIDDLRMDASDVCSSQEDRRRAARQWRAKELRLRSIQAELRSNS
jgi:hypothetical protein